MDLVLSNHSPSTAIRIDAVEASVPWIRIDIGGKRAPFPLAPNDSAAMTVRIDTLSLTEDYRSGEVVVQTSLGRKGCQWRCCLPPGICLGLFRDHASRCLPLRDPA